MVVFRSILEVQDGEITRTEIQNIFSSKFSFPFSLVMGLQEISILRELSDISTPRYMIDIFTWLIAFLRTYC